MSECFSLALQAEGRTSPNPMVGAVVLSKEGDIVGRGFHAKAGEAHAEVHAFREAGAQALAGTLYVSLEPCSHWGRTPPCVDAVIKSGVKKVVIAQADPNPKVAGAGMKALRSAGIEVLVGLGSEEAEWINRGFLKRMREALPWVCLKMAVTLDGKIADRFGSSRWISSEQSRLQVHRLRNKFDAVLVGGNTLRLDDPELTVRGLEGDIHQPCRIAIDTNLELQPTSRFCTTMTESTTYIICDAAVLKDKPVPLPQFQYIPVNSKADGLDLNEAMLALGALGLNTILSEGGSLLAGSLLQARLVDELYWVVASAVLGDAQAVSAIDLRRPVHMAEITKFQLIETSTVGSDVWMHMRK